MIRVIENDWDIINRIYSDIQARYIKYNGWFKSVIAKLYKFLNLTNAKESKLINMLITLYQTYENQNRSVVWEHNEGQADKGAGWMPWH